MLRLHPDVWMPWKEIHYFDSADPETDSGYAIQSRTFRARLGWRYIAWRLALRSVPGARALARRYMPLQATDAPGYRWSARYLLGEVSLDWYRRLFEEGWGQGRCCGEITPAYFMLSERGIAEFAQVLPHAQVFLLLRNPLDWAWSGICKDARDAGLDPSALSVDELMARCPTPDGRSRADFGANLDRWLTNFPRDRLFVGFYDHIVSQPVPFLDELCAFIGITPLPEHVRSYAGARINSSALGLPIPRAVELHVARRFLGEAETMADRLGGPATEWLEEIRNVLRQTPAWIPARMSRAPAEGRVAGRAEDLDA